VQNISSRRGRSPSSRIPRENTLRNLNTGRSESYQCKPEAKINAHLRVRGREPRATFVQNLEHTTFRAGQAVRVAIPFTSVILTLMIILIVAAVWVGARVMKNINKP
jgi:hypothetical protein